MFPCEMARYRAGFWREERKLGRFCCSKTSKPWSEAGNLGGQEFESLRARHFGTELGTPKAAVFALEAATSVRSSSLFDPMMRSSCALELGPPVVGGRHAGLHLVGDDLPAVRRAVAPRLAALVWDGEVVVGLSAARDPQVESS